MMPRLIFKFNRYFDLNLLSHSSLMKISSLVSDGAKNDSGKRLKLAYDFIASIDGTGMSIQSFAIVVFV